jgi:Zn-dependent peptidase ImmA (M78 family)/transcriptional regulator with XRE-family HTH domain
MDHVALGRRLREARERRELSQQAVADALELHRTAITLIEGGQRQVSTAELTKFSGLYRMSVGELLSSDEPKDDPMVVLYRLAPQLENDPRVKLSVERCLDLCKVGIELEAALGRPARMGPPSFQVSIPQSASAAIEQGTEVADEERRRLGLGHAPIRDICSRITEQGVWAVTTPLDTQMSGFFMHHPDIGLVVIANANHPPARRRFSFAHEYGHALMDRDLGVQITSITNADDLVEKRANAFAAAFLLPAQGVEHFLGSIGKGRVSRQQQAVYDVASNGRFDVEGRASPNSQRITYQDVAALADSYGVSYEAATYRLHNLGHLDRTTMQELLTKQPLAAEYLRILRSQKGDLFRSQSTGAPGVSAAENGPELRSQILGLAMEAFRREEISRGRLLEIGKRLDIASSRLLDLIEAEQSL